MYKLYTDAAYAEGIRVLRGTGAGEYETYELAVVAALGWLKQDESRHLMNVCIVSADSIKTLEIGQRYDIYRGILSHPGMVTYFDEIEIQESPYKITGVYRGTSEDMEKAGYSCSEKSYICLHDVKGFSKISNLKHGSSWSMSCFNNMDTARKWCVVVGASVMHYVDWEGTKVCEFDTEDEAKWRMYEMVLNGWEAASTLYARG